MGTKTHAVVTIRQLDPHNALDAEQRRQVITEIATYIGNQPAFQVDYSHTPKVWRDDAGQVIFTVEGPPWAELWLSYTHHPADPTAGAHMRRVVRDAAGAALRTVRDGEVLQCAA